MRTVVLSLALIVLWTAVCAAGQIRGNIYVGKTPIAGKTVEIKTGKSLYTTKTAGDGSFKLNVREQGKCVLSLVSGEKKMSIAIDSRRETMTYELEIVRRDGIYTLIKRR